MTDEVEKRLVYDHNNTSYERARAGDRVTARGTSRLKTASSAQDGLVAVGRSEGVREHAAER